MQQRDPVMRFLYDVYGHARIAEFLRNGKPEGISWRDFLEGTIIGTTIGTTTAYRGYNPNNPGLGQPVIPQVRQNFELDTGKIGLFDPSLPYHLLSDRYFRGMTEQQVAGFLEQRVLPVLESPTYNVYMQGQGQAYTWMHEIRASGIRVVVKVSSRNNPKIIVVDFYAQTMARAEMQRTISQYQASLPTRADAKVKN